MIGQGRLGRKAFQNDTAPYIRPAGIVTKIDGEGAKACLTQPLDTEHPSTPPHIKKYRQSTVHEPGKIVRHQGLADDPVQAGPFGMTTVAGDDVVGLIRTYPQSELMQWRLERQEDVYESSKREPLGKSYMRGHKLPEGLGGEKPFGTIIGAMELNAHPKSKDLIYPTGLDEDGPGTDTHARYVKTHGDYGPGEQRDRNYDWEKAGVDPKTFQFGMVDKNGAPGGVGKALNPTTYEDYKDTAKIVARNIEEFKITSHVELGKSRNLGLGEKGVEKDHVFGVPSRQFEEQGVQALISGGYSAHEQEPDADLGKSLRAGYRNIVLEGDDPSRAFGAPTIRTDIPIPKSKSVADDQNYGNEPDAVTLLYPASAAERGVFDEDYQKPMTREEMKAFYTSCGIAIEDDEFEAAYGIAAEKLDHSDRASLCSFQRVRVHLQTQAV